MDPPLGSTFVIRCNSVEHIKGAVFVGVAVIYSNDADWRSKLKTAGDTPCEFAKLQFCQDRGLLC